MRGRGTNEEIVDIDSCRQKLNTSFAQLFFSRQSSAEEHQTLAVPISLRPRRVCLGHSPGGERTSHATTPTHTHRYTHAQTFSLTLTHMHTLSHKLTHNYTFSSNTHTHIYSLSLLHIYLYTLTHIFSHTHTLSKTYTLSSIIHTLSLSHIHTLIHTHTHICAHSPTHTLTHSLSHIYSHSFSLPHTDREKEGQPPIQRPAFCSLAIDLWLITTHGLLAQPAGRDVIHTSHCSPREVRDKKKKERRKKSMCGQTWERNCLRPARGVQLTGTQE